MAIPTRFDGQLGEINDVASGILVSLKTMHRAAPQDVPLMRGLLREKMQAYVELVFSLADEVAER
jgi:hypothetical protein